MTKDQEALHEFIWRNTITDEWRHEDHEHTHTEMEGATE